MANHNRNSANTTANNSNNNSNQETIMNDPIQAMIDAQRDVQKNKDWKMSEISKLKKELAKELDIINNACRTAVKNISSEIERKQIELLFEQKKLEVREQYEPKIEALKIDLETAGEAFGTLAGDKVGAFVAPATKTVTGFFGTALKRAGLKK